MHFAFPSCAQSPPQTENRFLFIINTSSAMRPMTNAIQQAVLGLLKSHMQGQMRDGDTFGIWTYDGQLHADFAMQVWSKQNQAAILQTVSHWLAERRYQNRPHLEKVLPAARQIIANSRVVTLIFIFDGSESMQGTGFDKDINALHKDIGRQMRADHIPFVTVLAARDGKFFDYRVRTPASVSLPQTADFFKPAETNAVLTVAATNVPPPAVVPKLPEPRHLEIVLKPTEPPKTNPPPVAVSAPVAQSAPEKPEPVIQPAPPPVQPAPTPVQVPPAVVLAPTEPAKVPVVAPPADSSNPQSAIRNPQSSTAPPRTDEIPKPPPNPNPNPNPTAPPIAAPDVATGSGGVASSLRLDTIPSPHEVGRGLGRGFPPVQGSQGQDAPPAAPPESSPPPTKPEGRAGPEISGPAAPAETPPPPVKSVPATPVVPALSTPHSPQTTNRSPLVAPHPAPPAVPTAVALPSPTDHLTLLVIAFSLVTIAGVLVFFLIRRSRTPPSLISQSMDRPQ